MEPECKSVERLALNMAPNCHSPRRAPRVASLSKAEDKRRFGSGCIRLQSPCHACAHARVALKDEPPPRSLSQHIHTVFRRALYEAARSHVSPRAAGFRGIESADGGVVQSPSMMYSCSAVCLPDNLRSQYPEANLKPLSLSPRVEM